MRLWWRDYLELVYDVERDSIQSDESYQSRCGARISEGMGQDHGTGEIRVAHDQGHIAMLGHSGRIIRGGRWGGRKRG